MARLEISLLGPLRIALDGQPVAGLSLSRARALLAYLAVERHRAHPRAVLADLLWPDSDETSALTNLRHVLAQLRQALGDAERTDIPFLLISREAVQLNPQSDCLLDAAAFEQAASDVKGDLSSLAAAVALYRGPFLEGFSVDSVPFEEWATVQRERWQREVLGALARLATFHEERGEYAEAQKWARRAVQLDPTREEGHRQLMRALALGGERSAALGQYEACRRVLAEELEAEPAPETTALYEAIRQGSLVGSPSRPAPLLVPAHPTERTAGPLSTNLPAQASPFIGREGLLGDLLERLRDPACRLLTLVGPGGSGKTRLALEAGERLVENRPCRDDAPGGPPRGAAPTEAKHPEANHPVASPYLPTDGIFLASLAPLRSPETIAPTIAAAVGCSLSGSDPRPPEGQLLVRLRDKTVLLILDNCEHLLPEMRLVSAILEAAPEVKVLATTRERLNVQGEHLLPVSGMELPEVGDGGGRRASECGAVQLFLQGARQVRPGYESDEDELEQIAQVCRRVQGMPLAIVLATGWMGMLGPSEIDAEIARSLDFLSGGARDLPERQRSVRAAFEHSWRLLAREEQSALAALSVCRGSCDYEAAYAVSGTTLITVRALVNKSLLQAVAGGRLEMHELLRQYAAEMLERAPEAGRDARGRHAAYYMELLAQLDPRARFDGWAKSSASLRPDIENARAAWEWSAAQGDVARLERGMVALCWFYFGEGRTREGTEACDLALAAEAMRAAVPGAVGWSYLRGQALTWKGSFQHWGADYRQARATFRQGLEALEKAETQGRDTRLERALVLERLSDAAQVRGEYATSIEYGSESLALFREVGADRWVAQVQMQVGWMTFQMGRGCAGARQALEESVMILRRIDDRRGLARTLGPLAVTTACGGDLTRAERLAREALAIAQEGSERVLMGVVTFSLGHVLINGGRFAEAEVLLERAAANPVGAGDQVLGVENYALGMARMHHGSYAQAYPPLERAKALCLRFGSLVAAHAASRLGAVALAEGDYAEATAHYEEALPPLRQSGAICLEGLAGPMLTELGLGHRDKAQLLLIEDLRSSVATDYAPWRAGALAGAAAWLAEHGQPERAVEIYALASQHPQIAASRWWADVVGRHVTAAASARSPEVVVAAQERGRASNVQATLCELLAELES